MTRLFLEEAKAALAEAGAPCEPTSAEQRVLDFDANIENIGKITVQIGGFFDGHRTYTVRLDEHLHFWVDDMMMPAPSNFDIPEDYPMSKSEFLDRFTELHVGEWCKNHSTERFGYVIMDGTQWELTIEYNNGHKPFIGGGSNSFPYNFKLLLEMLGIEDEFEEETEKYAVSDVLFEFIPPLMHLFGRHLKNRD